MKVEDQLSQNLPFQGRLTLKQVKDQPFQGRLAQLVQSVCLTSRGSGVRIPQRPHRILCSSLVSFGRRNGFFKSKKLAIFSRRLSTVKWLSLLVYCGLSFWSPSPSCSLRDCMPEGITRYRQGYYQRTFRVSAA